MLPLLFLLQEAQHATEGALPAPFQPTWGLFFWTWVVFIPLLYLLSKLVLPVIVRMTAEREALITSQLAEAERLQAEAKTVLEEQRELLAGARGESQAILAEARQAAERERTTASEKIRQEQEEMLTRARAEIGAERDRARADVRREAVDLAIAAAGKVIERQLDATADRAMIEEYLTQIGTRA